MGILKTNFFSSSTVRVGTSEGSTVSVKPVASKNGLVLQPTKAVAFERTALLRFQVTYDGEPLAEQEVSVG